MAEMSIGCRVRVNGFNEIMPEKRSPRVSMLCGKEGVIVDKMYSEKNGEFVFVVKFDSFDKDSSKLWTEDQLEVVESVVSEIDFKFDVVDNVVVCICTEDGEEVGRGHGHIIHEGRIGVVQAASYALKRLYERMNGGTIYGQDRKSLL